MTKEEKERDNFINAIQVLEHRIKKLEAAMAGQSKVLKEQGTYITHMRKLGKKTKL